MGAVAGNPRGAPIAGPGPDRVQRLGDAAGDELVAGGAFGPSPRSRWRSQCSQESCQDSSRGSSSVNTCDRRREACIGNAGADGRACRRCRRASRATPCAQAGGTSPSLCSPSACAEAGVSSGRISPTRCDGGDLARAGRSASTAPTPSPSGGQPCALGRRGVAREVHAPAAVPLLALAPVEPGVDQSLVERLIGRLSEASLRSADALRNGRPARFQ
jgi:hypothetical protein